RLDFDLAGAVRLAMTQIAVCAAIILVASSMSPVPTALGRSAQPRWRDGRPARALQWFILAVCVIGFALPLLSVLVDGLGSGLMRVVTQPAFWQASVNSMVIGAASALLTLVLALGLALGRGAIGHRGARTLLGAPAYAYLAVPAVVLSLGLFLLVRDFGISVSAAAPFVVVGANSLLALPFAMATLGPPLDAIIRRRGKLLRSLGLTGWQQLSVIEYPLLARDLGLMLALAFCF